MADEQTQAGSQPVDQQPEPDDGFTAEERAQFEDMRSADQAAPDAPAQGSDAPAVDTAAADAAAAAAVDAAAAGTAAEADDDDDEGDDAAADAAAVAAGGQPQARNPSRARVSRRKWLDAEDRAKKAVERAAAAEAASETERQRFARADERLQILTQALTTPKAQEQTDDDPEPDVEADIFAHNAWLKRQLVRTNEALGRMQSGQQAEASDNSLSTAYMDDARSFAAREPNFIDSYQYLMASRVAELALYYTGKDVTVEGTTLTPQEMHRIRGTIAEEEKQLAASALIAQRDNPNAPGPAARVMALAKSRGWRPREAAPQNGNGAAANGAAPANGAARPAGAAPANGAAKPSVKEEIERVQRGVDASVSLSGGGGTPANPLTAQKLADMPEHEFKALVDRMSPEEFRAIMEGT